MIKTQDIVHVKAIWDSEANVWVATSDEVPGLITEAGNTEDLINKLKIMIPELLEANGMISKFKSMEIPFSLLSERSEIAKSKGL